MKIKMFISKLYKKIFKIEDKRIDYICGGEALPQPLAPEREVELVKAFQKGDESAKDILIEHNLRLVVYIAKRFENSGIDIDDLISIGSIGLIKAVNNYSLEKNIKLATFASRCIENEILMHIRKTSKQKQEVSLDEPLNVDGEGNMLVLADILGTDGDILYNDLEMGLEKELLLKIFLRLPERERQIVEMRFGLFDTEEKTQKEIADSMNISQSYISRLEKKIILKLRKEMIKHLS